MGNPQGVAGYCLFVVISVIIIVPVVLGEGSTISCSGY